MPHISEIPRAYRLLTYFAIVTAVFLAMSLSDGVTVFATSGAPVVDSITPNEVRNVIVLNVDIFGSNFSAPEELILRQNNRVIEAMNVQIISTNQINCDFDFTGESPGQYTLEIKTEDGFGDLKNAMLVKGHGTAVDLAEFNAYGLDREIRIEWETASEEDNAGWNLYRVLSNKGEYEAINASIIDAYQSSYQFIDTDLKNGEEYCYVLEALDLAGKVERFGPACAVPAGSADSIDNGSENDENDDPDNSEDNYDSDNSGCGM